jgi:Pyruvate/2-oxoacid:ferredoxin oxidoreductase delta subunit
MAACNFKADTVQKNQLEQRSVSIWNQGCQMVYFHTKLSNFGVFRKAMELNFLCPFVLFSIHLLCHGCVLYCPHFGILYQEKSGNPVWNENCAKKNCERIFTEKLFQFKEQMNIEWNVLSFFVMRYFICDPRTDVLILKIFSPKNSQNLSFLLPSR